PVDGSLQAAGAARALLGQGRHGAGDGQEGDRRPWDGPGPRPLHAAPASRAHSSATTRWTWSARARASRASRPAVANAGWMVSRTVPGFIRRSPRGAMRFTPASETGTIGTPALKASTKLPRLKARTAASRLRVPSGKTATLVPPRIRSAARARLRRASKARPRSIP